MVRVHSGLPLITASAAWTPAELPRFSAIRHHWSAIAKASRLSPADVGESSGLSHGEREVGAAREVGTSLWTRGVTG